MNENKKNIIGISVNFEMDKTDTNFSEVMNIISQLMVHDGVINFGSYIDSERYTRQLEAQEHSFEE